jgi:hypothetical protein
MTWSSRSPKSTAFSVFQPRLVFGIERRPLPVEGPGIGDRDLVGRQRAVLPAVDDRGELPRGPAFFVDLGGDDQLFHQPDLVVGVEDGEVRLQIPASSAWRRNSFTQIAWNVPSQGIPSAG